MLLLKQQQKPLCNDKALEKRDAFFPPGVLFVLPLAPIGFHRHCVLRFVPLTSAQRKLLLPVFLAVSFPPHHMCSLIPLPPSLPLSLSLSHSCLLALPCSVIPPVSRNAVVFNFFQLLWHCARPPAFPHLLPVMPHKHGQHIKTAGSQPSAWPTPGTLNPFIYRTLPRLLNPSVTGTYTELKHSIQR